MLDATESNAIGDGDFVTKILSTENTDKKHAKEVRRKLLTWATSLNLPSLENY